MLLLPTGRLVVVNVAIPEPFGLAVASNVVPS
jgi:hypothetical protein